MATVESMLNFLKGFNCTGLLAVVNVVQAQQEKYCKDFNTTASYVDHIVTKRGYTIQSIHIDKTTSQPVKIKVVTFMEKIECKKYPKAMWKSMSREQQMQVWILCEQQGIKHADKKPHLEARIAAVEAQFRVNSQHKESDVKQ